VLGALLTVSPSVWYADHAMKPTTQTTSTIATLVLAATVALFSTACRNPQQKAEQAAKTLTGGDPSRGRTAIGKYGCGSCHFIPGVEGATATVGPPLDNIALRATLGGHLTNTPDNMKLWIQNPQKIDPKNVMPDMGITDQDAKDITAYLYTLKGS
jgi:cytochrome c